MIFPQLLQDFKNEKNKCMKSIKEKMYKSI